MASIPSRWSASSSPSSPPGTSAKAPASALSVAHGIATAHGGTILVESELGHGSRFDAYLPICSDVAHKQPGPSARLLYLSGDRILADTHAEGLRSLGYEITVLRDAAELAAMRGKRQRTLRRRARGAADAACGRRLAALTGASPAAHPPLCTG
jgi:hypothetical protein